MKQGNAIEVHNVTKSFKVYYDKGSELKEKLLFKNRNRYENRLVLNDISFEVKKGEAIGLIGHNGCGKSTTLKLLTKIIYPDSGSIEMKGRVSALIELGAGFHPDMSGRENIYTNAAIFGLSRREINERIDDIIRFSELEEFIDNPVRTYSSGMYMRLAFAVAINVDADILLIDEILAVGDAGFQAKCFEKLREIKRNGTTIVIVSHALESIEMMCERSIWIDKGEIREIGKPKYVHEHYLAEMEEKRLARKDAEEKQIEERKEQEEINQDKENDSEKTNKEQIEQKKEPEKLPSFCSEYSVRIGNRDVEFVNVELLNEKGESSKVFKCKENMTIRMHYHRNVESLDGNFGIGIFRDDGVHCYGTNILIEEDRLVKTKKDGIVELEITDNCLLPGKYMLDVAIHSEDGIRYDDIRNIIPFQIRSMGKRDVGVCRLESKWNTGE